jgi:hypothetical protein
MPAVQTRRTLYALAQSQVASTQTRSVTLKEDPFGQQQSVKS